MFAKQKIMNLAKFNFIPLFNICRIGVCTTGNYIHDGIWSIKSITSDSKLNGSPPVTFSWKTTLPSWSSTYKSLWAASHSFHVGYGDWSAQTLASFPFVQFSKELICWDLPTPISLTWSYPFETKFPYKSLSCPNRAVQVPQL